VRFICGLRSAKRSSSCSEWFDSWAELADHLNIEHRLSVWIAGGTITQEMFRSDYRKRREIIKWQSGLSQPCIVGK